MGKQPLDLRTFSEAIKLAMTAENMTGQVTVDVGEAGSLTAWVGKPDPDDFIVTVIIRRAALEEASKQ